MSVPTLNDNVLLAQIGFAAAEILAVGIGLIKTVAEGAEVAVKLKGAQTVSNT